MRAGLLYSKTDLSRKQLLQTPTGWHAAAYSFVSTYVPQIAQRLLLRSRAFTASIWVAYARVEECKFSAMAEIQNCAEMAFLAVFSLFKCYRMFSSLFMDQINLQSFCQAESELISWCPLWPPQSLPKINADRSPPVSHIKTPRRSELISWCPSQGFPTINADRSSSISRIETRRNIY